MAKAQIGNKQRESKPYRKKANSVTILQPGWSGVFVSCPRGKEAQCRNEILEVAKEYIETHYPELMDGYTQGDGACDSDEDIEATLKRELAEIKAAKPLEAISTHLIGIECVVFLRLKSPLEPVKFVRDVCEKVAETGVSHCRNVQRLSPVTLLISANLDQLDKFEDIINTEFTVPNLKFAIRPTTRNNNKLTREGIIPAVAKLVGPSHSVDLKNYDKLIIVECFKSVIGLSILGKEFEHLNRFNLSQLVQKAAEARAAEQKT